MRLRLRLGQNQLHEEDVGSSIVRGSGRGRLVDAGANADLLFPL